MKEPTAQANICWGSASFRTYKLKCEGEMTSSILIQLEDLKKKITNSDISVEARSIKEWGGADVIIKLSMNSKTSDWFEDQSLVISFQNTEPRRRAVITEHAKELSWLFYRLREIFSERIDYLSKYDFYGRLAQSANDFLTNNTDMQDARPLLLTVLDTAKEFYEDTTSK